MDCLEFSSVPDWGQSQKADGSYGTTTIHSEHALEGNLDSIPLIDISPIFSADLSARQIYRSKTHGRMYKRRVFLCFQSRHSARLGGWRVCIREDVL